MDNPALELQVVAQLANINISKLDACLIKFGSKNETCRTGFETEGSTASLTTARSGESLGIPCQDVSNGSHVVRIGIDKSHEEHSDEELLYGLLDVPPWHIEIFFRISSNPN